jgi:hypothetical protein
MKYYVLLFVLLLCAGCDGVTEPQQPQNHTNVVIGNTHLVIPKSYIVSEVSSLGPQNSLDTSTGVLLKIPMKDLGFEHGDQNNLVKYITLLVSPITDHFQNSQLGPDAIDAWIGRGLYRKRVIEFDETFSLYRIAPKSGHPKLWHYFKEKPTKTNKNNAEWIGHCMVGPLASEAKDMSNVACTKTFINPPLQIEVTFAGPHINSIDAIYEVVVSTMNTWTKS